MRPNYLVCAALFLALGAAPNAVAEPSWGVEKTIHVGGEGGWDYLTVDAPNHRLFVTRTTHTQAIDVETGKVVGDMPGQIRSHGVALVPKLDRGFITDGGGSGAIIVFDLKTYAVLGKLAAIPDTDGIIYDTKTDLILAVSGDGHSLMTIRPDIDPKNGKIESPIDLGGSPEFLAAADGKAYINLEDKDVVAVVDLNSRKVIARWPVTPGGHPVGMSMDRGTHRLFIGCRNPQKLVVMNAENGKVLASVPIGAGVDATGFHGGQAFASCRDGSLVVVGETGGKFAVGQTVKTPLGARTMGIDTANRRVYLPTAEFDASTSSGRPQPKPGSFMVVVVGQM